MSKLHSEGVLLQILQVVLLNKLISGLEWNCICLGCQLDLFSAAVVVISEVICSAILAEYEIKAAAQASLGSSSRAGILFVQAG